MPEQNRRVLIVGAVTMNGGDAALLLALVARARAAWGETTDIRVADATPEASANRYPDLTFVPSIGVRSPKDARRIRAALRYRSRPRRFRLASLLPANIPAVLRRLILPPGEDEAFRHYLWADTVVMTGGTALVEHYPLRDRWIGLELAVWLKRPLVLFTQSLGPFDDPENQAAMRRVASSARLILLRDAKSLGHLRAIDAETKNSVVSADAAFGLDSPSSSDHTRTKPTTAAISVRSWPYASDVQGHDTSSAYREAVAQLAMHLVRSHGLVVEFLSTCQGDSRYWTDDSREASIIAEMLPVDVSQAVTVNREFHTPEQLLERLTTFDLVVATRMHMAILSLIAGRPVLPIAYEFKTEELFRQLGTGQLTTSLADIGPELIDRADELLANLTAVRAKQLDGAALERQTALDTNRLLRECLL